MNTSNGHRVFDNGVEKPMEGDILIGRHVWIGSWANIAKSTCIADGCIVAQSSLVSGRHDTPNTLIAGMPAKDIKNNYSWKG
jgi:acetyltransferase-like isoleucine patch superfamily enzyme